MKFNPLYLLIIPVVFNLCISACSQMTNEIFNTENVMEYIDHQLSFGPRIPNSSGSISAQNFIQREMENSNWLVERQVFEYNDIPLTNVIAKSSLNPPRLIIGTHYDTRAVSDNETYSEKQLTPVPGANDGGSGTAVLLELGNKIKKSDLDAWLVFFDAEDQGRINNWEWSIGAQYFVDHLETIPEAVLIIDMIGDQNLEIYMEKNSDILLTKSVWEEAEKLGFSSFFIPKKKYSIIDDHLPFINKGIPATLIIDIDYPYWHTTKDTSSNISQDSLKIIGTVLLSWVKNQY
jgi:glutaminyl-peptide cyclotransferase